MSEKGARAQMRSVDAMQIVEIARALAQERDITRLLGLILEKCRLVTAADAGSIYVVEGNQRELGQRALRFKLSQNDSVAFESREFTIPVSMRSIAGASALTQKAINIPDVYALDATAPYSFDRSFDEKVGYRTRSVLTVPLISAQKEVIGVIQLINHKLEQSARLSAAPDNQVGAFDERCEELLQIVAAQAGIALENALLYDEINRIFEGFVRASVQAIEQRDPTTSGHSLRVSVLSTELATAVDRIREGPYKNAAFSARDMKELEYAAMLHDFGKIGVREDVLVKAKKLYPHKLQNIETRFAFVRKQLEAEAFRRKLEVMQRGGGESDLRAVEIEVTANLSELDAAWQAILAANEPTVLKEGEFSRIAAIAQRSYTGPSGELLPLLDPDEVVSLQVQRGSLNESEIDQIRSHVVHTYEFLVRIPWGRSFAGIPEIAGAHHERLNGTGYPNRWTENRIPLPSKIMTVADIYDALTARDRPYKRAVPQERAIAILHDEVKFGHVDAELVRIFCEAQVFKSVERELTY